MSIKFGSEARYNTIATIFKPEEKTTTSGKLVVTANLSTGKKLQAPDADGKEYRNSNWRASFVGNAASLFKELGLQEKDRIEILSAEVETSYNKEKNQNYVNVTIFNFKKAEYNGSSSSSNSNSSTSSSSTSESTSDGFMNIPDGIDEELPFA